ncbi:serpin family protein [Cellulomonas xylanilytica]|uniref:Serpin n=1 Tax=Cellulomonas xylanilytica TaxID=233583 RepID=A0A510VBS3_9CELL|nr:serpin family protein [Cellulomonas xylanilytica]GEK22615.1 serpin [Cellulomonas xylanilytica]
MTRRRSATALLASGALLALSACATGPTGPAGPPAVHRGEVRSVELGQLTARDVAAAQTAFGLDLLHAVCAQRPQENLVLSPTSAAEALGMLYPSAGGGTAARIAELLHLPAWSPDLTAAVQQHTRALAGLAAPDGTDLTAEDAPDSLRVSNRLWAYTHADPTPQYLDAIATGYDASVETLDFADDPVGSTDRINAQISEDTAGLIPTLLDEPLPGDTYAVLTNALHLDATWSSPFVFTERAPFATPDGDRDVDLMHGADGTARSADGWVAAELPYRDGTMQAVAVLPPQGEDPCGLTGGTLDTLAGAEGEAAEVALPRLHLEQSHDLLETLMTLGLPVTGDFRGLGTGNLEITKVVQKTSLRVDEQGTEAAAATAVVSEMVSAPWPPPVQVVLDRPFLLLLTDSATGSPLFTAVIHDPAP